MREEFEQWYLRVARGHPSNLLKDESGEYQYIGAMYLGWVAATLIEREACAKVCEDFDFNKREEIEPPRTLPRYLAAAIRTRQSGERSDQKLSGMLGGNCQERLGG